MVVDRTQNRNRVVRHLLLILILALILFGLSSLVPRKGAYVKNAIRYGDAEYRDNRGLPFVYLKRSLADNECEIASPAAVDCLPVQSMFTIQEQRQMSYLYLGLDVVFWFAISALSLWFIRIGGNSKFFAKRQI